MEVLQAVQKHLSLMLESTFTKLSIVNLVPERIRRAFNLTEEEEEEEEDKEEEEEKEEEDHFGAFWFDSFAMLFLFHATRGLVGH